MITPENIIKVKAGHLDDIVILLNNIQHRDIVPVINNTKLDFSSPFDMFNIQEVRKMFNLYGIRFNTTIAEDLDSIRQSGDSELIELIIEYKVNISVSVLETIAPFIEDGCEIAFTIQNETNFPDLKGHKKFIFNKGKMSIITGQEQIIYDPDVVQLLHLRPVPVNKDIIKTVPRFSLLEEKEGTVFQMKDGTFHRMKDGVYQIKREDSF